MASEKKTGLFSGFFAVLYYELLWNLRKKKIIGLFILAFVIVTLQLVLPPLLTSINGGQINPDPSFVYNSVGRVNGFFLFLMAVATCMNTISGEFETGTIVPLLTKPVSRTTVFAAKMTMTFLTLVAVFTFLGIYMTIGGILIRGPQNDLSLVPLGILGLTTGTMMWASIVVLLGTLSKNSLVASLGSFGFYIGISIVGALVAAFLGQSYILFFLPGDGATGFTGVCSTAQFGSGYPSGTNALGFLLMQWVKTPSQNLNFCGVRFLPDRNNTFESFQLSSGTVATVAANALGTALVYIEVLLIFAWAYFRHTEIME